MTLEPLEQRQGQALKKRYSNRAGRPRPELLSGCAATAAENETAADVRERVRQHGWRDCCAVCVIDAEGRLRGLLSPSELLALPDAAVVAEFAHSSLPPVPHDASPEHVASIALHHGLTAVPMVDAGGRLAGVADSRTLMQVLRREHVEDLHRLAGIGHEAKQARRALEAPPVRRLRHRLPWLLVGLAGSALATLVVSRFEAALQAHPAIAFFVPALVYLADAIGTQTEAIAVRGLSLSRVSLRQVMGGELRTGLLIGVVLALLAHAMAWLAFRDFALAVAVALSLAAASTVATLLGLLLPWLLGHLGSDPAYGSGPVATIVQDVMTLLIYFGFVSAFVA